MILLNCNLTVLGNLVLTCALGCMGIRFCSLIFHSKKMRINAVKNSWACFQWYTIWCDPISIFFCLQRIFSVWSFRIGIIHNILDLGNITPLRGLDDWLWPFLSYFSHLKKKSSLYKDIGNLTFKFQSLNSWNSSLLINIQ